MSYEIYNLNIWLYILHRLFCYIRLIVSGLITIQMFMQRTSDVTTTIHITNKLILLFIIEPATCHPFKSNDPKLPCLSLIGLKWQSSRIHKGVSHYGHLIGCGSGINPNPLSKAGVSNMCIVLTKPDGIGWKFHCLWNLVCVLLK